MAKERKPIATRTRNRTKSQEDNNNSLLSSISSPTIAITHKETKSKQSRTKIDKAKRKINQKHKDNDHDKEDESPSAFRDFSFQLPYLPKSNFNIHLQELHQLPSSFIRGTTAEKRRDILRNDQNDYYSMTHFNPDSINTKYTKKKPFFMSDDMGLNGKHAEYSICLHRAFIKKRYLSDQECMHLAKYVNCDFYTQSLQELAMLIKDELYMYRIDFTEKHLHHIRTMNITKEAFLKKEKDLEKTLEKQN
ncbi:hypothetical protein INT46_006066 [Mucor plumbeus]|uniref:Uncharacterized protein n=1 Tax=Mucor plumbeus TaxID=97098 RepID=A0A8H7QR41_9FUNG|nr:hypothetical protein INT46_006066 [Mucor plumbeus]